MQQAHAQIQISSLKRYQWQPINTPPQPPSSIRIWGSVNKSEHYRNAVKQAGLIQSMGNAGLSFANQIIECFFGKIETELLQTQSWKSNDVINRAITLYCTNFYNSLRPLMVLAGRTPLEEFHHLPTSTPTKVPANFA